MRSPCASGAPRLVRFTATLALAGLAGCGGAATLPKGFAPQGAPERFAFHADGADGARHDTESYDRIYDNEFLDALRHPLSTFALDVDTASYANVRRFLKAGQFPPKDAVRLEELLNYFPYSYSPPRGPEPFAAHPEVAGCPWNAEHRLVRIGLKGRELPADRRPPANLVFLIDVSGSMDAPSKLPLVKESLRLLTGQLTERDRVAVVVYAGAAGLVLPSTTGADKGAITGALDRLQAGGSTAGGAGIQLAYQVALANFAPGGSNRVILCTDGDFNVGVSSPGELVRMVEERAKGQVFLTVLGFGMGNLKDSTLEKLADKGNGHYAYIDTLNEARKVLVEQVSGTLFTVAKDVKFQVEFNPAAVGAYRLLGYENRLLRAEDFNNDRKDAGEVGAGHTVTALYEVVPAGKSINLPGVDPLKYQRPRALAPAAEPGELLTLKVRYKEPAESNSRLLVFPVTDPGTRWEDASDDFRFAAAVAEFGMLLRDSPYKGAASYPGTWALARTVKGLDPHGYRAEFLQLLEVAGQLAKRNAAH